MSAIRSADKLITQVEEEKLENLSNNDDKTEINKSIDAETLHKENKLEEKIDKPEEVELDHKEKPQESEDNVGNIDKKEVEDKKLDEYGNEIPKPRMYTEEEVNKMVRERLSRGSFAQNQQNSQVQEAVKDFKADPGSSESWEVQLDNFVRNTIVKMTQEQVQKQHQEHESKVQNEFETRFTTGMSKYQDFQDVVQGKPITNAMMLATRGMADPAAFIYSAAKHQTKELERIAQISDPYQQGAEMGKLEERMRKTRVATAAARPLSKTVGDIAGKEEPKRSIDNLIRQEERRKFRR